MINYLIEFYINAISVTINIIFLWIGMPNPCLRLTKRPQAFFLEKRCAFFEKARLGQPKPCLRLNRWPQAFFVNNDMPF